MEMAGEIFASLQLRAIYCWLSKSIELDDLVMCCISCYFIHVTCLNFAFRWRPVVRSKHASGQCIVLSTCIVNLTCHVLCSVQ